MSALDKAEKLIREFEGCAFRAYRTQYPGGLDVWSIGFGSTRGVIPDMVIDYAKAERRLAEDLQETNLRVDQQVRVPLSENQRAALLSFTFNEGVGHLHESTTLHKLNAGDYTGAADALLLWDKVRGVKVAGLDRRRDAERALFLAA